MLRLVMGMGTSAVDSKELCLKQLPLSAIENKFPRYMQNTLIGTLSAELGVITTFSDISGFEAICEVEERKAGYNPELSYGSHIFQDLLL